MAVMDTETIASSLSKPGAKPAKSAASKTEGISTEIRFPRSQFITDEAAGVKRDKHGKRQEGADKREAVITEDLRTQYGVFMRGHVEILLKIADKRVLDNPVMDHEKQLVNLLVTNGQPDMAKITKFLETSDGLLTANQVLEYETTLRLFGQGLNNIVLWGDRTRRSCRTAYYRCWADRKTI